ncbi:hypothetical protein B0G82_5678 [Paraburkholderia sp. BL17N1]|nr:hypothetical protein B0G82_5678 [Paraburkholderia sp. BL17N1]
MYLKFLSIAMLAVCCSATASEVVALPQLWHDSHYASCYPSVKAGMSEIYGMDFEQDENILQSHRHIGSRDFVIASDSTSGTNGQRTVFEQRDSKSWCVVLTSSPVAELVPGPVSASLRQPLT